eukprot:1341681-Amorphochlora_amoeboformis.AAC.1
MGGLFEWRPGGGTAQNSHFLGTSGRAGAHRAGSNCAGLTGGTVGTHGAAADGVYAGAAPCPVAGPRVVEEERLGPQRLWSRLFFCKLLSVMVRRPVSKHWRRIPPIRTQKIHKKLKCKKQAGKEEKSTKSLRKALQLAGLGLRLRINFIY